MLAQLKRGHCTALSTVLATPPSMVKDKSGGGGHIAAGRDPINEGVTGCTAARLGCYGMSK